MPQRDSTGAEIRTPAEKAEFNLMLGAIADLYLTANVLILLDTSYLSRFWTLTEAWCSMQAATKEGLRPVGPGEPRRYTIKCIHNASYDFAAPALENLVGKNTAADMSKILKAPDVLVTNQKDKDDMIPIIEKIDENVKKHMNGELAPHA